MERVRFFDDKYIVKIAVGRYHALFLENNGITWTAGSNDPTPSSRGRKSSKSSWAFAHVSKAMLYFVNNKIQIIDIDVGMFHNLAVDIGGNIYSWGRNKHAVLDQ